MTRTHSIRCWLFTLLFFVFIPTGKTIAQEFYRSVSEMPPVRFKETSELNLNEKYIDAAVRESALAEEDILAAVNRWHIELYPGSPKAATAYMLATVLDPVTSDLVEEFKEALGENGNLDEKIPSLFKWLQTRMCHTQMTGLFKDQPGRDPWGMRDDGKDATYKKLLPSEMLAMELRTGRVSGKCMTLANLITSLFLHIGVDPMNLVLVISQTPSGYRHGNAIVSYQGKILFINNNAIGPFMLEPLKGAPPVQALAVYNHCDFKETDFMLDADLIDDSFWQNDKPLMDRFLEAMNLQEVQKTFGSEMDLSLNSVDELREQVFSNPGGSSMADLVKYAYQSLYVKHPEKYLKASTRTSHAKTLAGTLESPAQVFEWIRQHIRLGSIFPDGGERLMTADQVMVFQQGSLKDQAVLAATLLNHMGYQPEVYIASKHSYILFDGRTVDVCGWKDVKEIEEKVWFRLK